MSHIPQKTIKKIIQKHYNLLHYNNMKSQCFLFFYGFLQKCQQQLFARGRYECVNTSLLLKTFRSINWYLMFVRECFPALVF